MENLIVQISHLPVSSEDIIILTFGANYGFDELNEELDAILNKDKQVCIITDTNVYSLYAEELKSIFLPLAGAFAEEKLYNVGVAGFYRTRSAYDRYFAYSLYMDHTDVSVDGLTLSYGHSVRAVLPK